MALVLNHIAVTTTTPSFTRPIPSPVPFSSPSGNSAHRSSEGSIFTYSNAYPIPHCIHRSVNFEAQSMDFFSSNESRFDSVILDDDALTSLILEMELDKMNVLPELQVVNADLTDCSVVSTNGKQGSWFPDTAIPNYFPSVGDKVAVQRLSSEDVFIPILELRVN